MSVTIKDIAKRLNISVSTVSRALTGSYGVNKATSEKIRQAAEEMGYVPNLTAKELVKRKSNLAGFFIPQVDYEAKPMFFETFPSISKALKLHGKNTIIFSIDPQTYRNGDLLATCRERNLEGCIIAPVFGRDHPIYTEAKNLPLPSVVLGRVTGRRCSSVATDELYCAAMAVRYLIDSGHRAIGLINGPSGVPICEGRMAGYKAALEEAGLVPDPDLIVHSNFSGRGGAASIRDLLQRNKTMTAVFCANDLMAMGAITALYEDGLRVPDDLSVMGYDGVFFSEYFNPPLSTMRHNSVKIGIRAAELLLELTHGGTGKNELVRGELVIRKTIKRLESRNGHPEEFEI